MVTFLKIVGLAIVFLGAMQEVSKKSWSYIGKSLIILVVFLAYVGLGIWVLFAGEWGVEHSSAEAAVMVGGFFIWLFVGLIGMVLASPQEK